MKITLIAPPLMDYQGGSLVPISMDSVRTCPPYGIYLLATILRNHHHDVVIIDLIAQGSKQLDAHWGTLLNSHLIGIGVSSLSWPTAKECISEIRAYTSEIPIALGGIHATMFDSYLLHSTGANYVLRGEAEKTFPELCSVLQNGGDLRSVSNLSFKRVDGRIIKNSASPKMSETELAQQPVPDYSYLPYGVYTGLAIESSRGCPFDCIFCSTSYRKSWRGIPPSVFVDKIEEILPYTGYTNGGLIQIIDDEFSLETNRAIRICNEIVKRGLDLRLVFDSRANDLLKEDFIAAISPFAHQFLVGAECGYDEGLKQVGKGTTTEKLEKAAAMLDQHNMASKADFSFVIGLPWETKREVIKTVRFAYNLYSTYGIRILLQWYCQIPGSRLWEDQRKNEVLHEALYDDYGFFKNNHLFRSGIQLKPSEVHEVMTIIENLKMLSGRNVNGLDMIQNSDPDPIMQFYPDHSAFNTSSGIQNLREVAGVDF